MQASEPSLQDLRQQFWILHQLLPRLRNRTGGMPGKPSQGHKLQDLRLHQPLLLPSVLLWVHFHQRPMLSAESPLQDHRQRQRELPFLLARVLPGPGELRHRHNPRQPILRHPGHLLHHAGKRPVHQMFEWVLPEQGHWEMYAAEPPVQDQRL